MYCRAQSCGLVKCRGNKGGFGKVIGWTTLRLKVIIKLLLRLTAGKDVLGLCWLIRVTIRSAGTLQALSGHRPVLNLTSIFVHLEVVVLNI